MLCQDLPPVLGRCCAVRPGPPHTSLTFFPVGPGDSQSLLADTVVSDTAAHEVILLLLLLLLLRLPRAVPMSLFLAAPGPAASRGSAGNAARRWFGLRASTWTGFPKGRTKVTEEICSVTYPSLSRGSGTRVPISA